jgi:hypothetical protein
MTPGCPPGRTSRGHRLVFHRTSKPARALAILGLGALIAGYSAPIAFAAVSDGGDGWTLPAVTIPAFSFPEFERNGWRRRTAARRARCRRAGRPRTATRPPVRCGTRPRRPSYAMRPPLCSRPPACPRPPVPAAGRRIAGRGRARCAAARRGARRSGDRRHQLRPGAAGRVRRFGDDPYADAPVIDSTTGPLPVMGDDQLSAGSAQGPIDALDPTQLPPLPPDDSAVVGNDEARPGDKGEGRARKDRGERRSKGRLPDAGAARAVSRAATSAVRA